jgi:hypothetical protein
MSGLLIRIRRIWRRRVGSRPAESGIRRPAGLFCALPGVGDAVVGRPNRRRGEQAGRSCGFHRRRLRPHLLQFFFTTTSAAPPSACRAAAAQRAASSKLGPRSSSVHGTGPKFSGQRPCDLFSAKYIRCQARNTPSISSMCIELLAWRQGMSSRLVLAATLNKILPVLAFPLRGLRGTHGDCFDSASVSCHGDSVW